MCYYVWMSVTSLAAREIFMRPLSLLLLAAAVLGETPLASAQSPYSYPWCARAYKMDSNSTSCYYISYQQCMTTLSGIGGYCFQSPYYHAAPAHGPVRPRHHW
jgi:Protein of unknown function (DUF3551)